MAKRKATKKKSGKGAPVLKVVLITVGALFLGFLLLMQTVRMGVFGELPTEEELGAIRHEEATLVLARDGELIGKLFAEDRTNVLYEDLPKHLIDALVSTEDARFFSHEGVDGRSYIRVFFRTLHLFVLKDVQTGCVWFTKILTDPFHDVMLYWRAPIYLLKGELIDPMAEKTAH